MKASEARRNTIDAVDEEIRKIEAEITKASNEGKETITVRIPSEKHKPIEAYFKDNGFEVYSLDDYPDLYSLEITWL